LISTFIDTSYAVALVSPRDVDHQIAVDLSRIYDKKPLVTTDCVLLEIGNSLARNYREPAVDTLNNFLSSPEIDVVSLDKRLFDRAFELYRSRMDKTWGLVDCVSFIVMREREIKDALTSDGHFRQAGFNPLMLSVF